MRPIRGLLFEDFIANPVKAGKPDNALMIWILVAGIGVLSMIGVTIYDRVLFKKK